MCAPTVLHYLESAALPGTCLTVICEFVSSFVFLTFIVRVPILLHCVAIDTLAAPFLTSVLARVHLSALQYMAQPTG